ncbi:lish domain-containing protein armc9-like protein [Chrysochromulina tobinii]|uniref:LisH domain-containing protein ARMC9 n=1 Tax=Chrysochromulina tobinii TaxID=1460289 RepID=A0A0M0K6L4_9EUKA|nr:lish domain-containing protein armc9-like protein [Chrysochromulina tobinii]|eukprot:KOO34262.1 lish domain-containing protein armc9-like protein [Chrysochromulina sp. CCMP291]
MNRWSKQIGHVIADRGRVQWSPDEEVDLLVLEYLAHAGYERTTQQLKNELRERREGKQQNWRPVGRDMQDKVKDRMLRALDRGEREEVLKLWDNFVPPLVRRSDKNAQKLEFYLNIFFAIFPLHPTNPTPQPNNLGAAMRTFKTYLETDGAALAVTPEFLAYYAMPHVPDISRHPSFKELFSAEWARALKARLADFLARTPQFAAEPRLLGICRSYRELSAGASAGAEHPVANASRDLQALKQRLIDSELRAIEAKREAAAAAAVEAEREAALKRGSKELSGIAAEAISTLGEVLHPSALASIDASAVNVLRQRLHGAEERLGLELSDLGSHVAKVKQTMIAGSEGAPALVQALRWRLTKPARHQRKAALMQYIQNDLLEAAVPGLIQRLCSLLTSEAVDTVARQNCLGALQKLSLRRQPQNAMIQSGVIAWLVTQLADTDALSQYAIEYGTALLMNLSLRSEGRTKCVASELDILGVLSQLMESDSTQVRTYVNGTLYSILVRSELKARAAEALQYAEQAGGTGAFGASVGPAVEEDLPEEGTFASPGGAEDETIPEMVSYPDPDAVDVTSPTIPVRNRLSRTPHKKTRDASVPPVQPTASRPRATVERLHRRPTNNPPLDASPAKGGGSTSARNKPAAKPDAADEK